MALMQMHAWTGFRILGQTKRNRNRTWSLFKINAPSK